MAGNVFIDGQKLKQLREQRALSQEGLEQACSQKKGCSVSIATIKRAEIGSALSRRTIARLANFFSVPVEELLLTSQTDANQILLPRINKECLAVWIRTGSKLILDDVLERFSHLEPMTLEHLGNTLVVILPCIDDDQKLYLSLQSDLIDLSRRSSQYFKAIVSTQTVIQQPDDNRWHLDESYIYRMSELAALPEKAAVVVSDTLAEASKPYFLYGELLSSNGYKALLNKVDVSYGKTFGREHELQLLRYSVDDVITKKDNVCFAIQGVQGIGKSHMLHTLSGLFAHQDWRIAKLDFNFGLSPSHFFLSALGDVFNLTQEPSIESVDSEDYLNTLIDALVTHTESIGAVFLSLDNFHLIDEQCLATICRILASLRELPISLGVAYLPTDAAIRYVETLSTLNFSVTHLPLMPLSNTDMVYLLDSDRHVEPEASACIVSAEGNPYYFYKLIQSYKEDRIPTDISFYLHSKLNSLSPELNKVLSFIALANHPLTVNDVSNLTDFGPIGLETLVNMRLIRISAAKVISLGHPFLIPLMEKELDHEDKKTVYIAIANYLESQDKLGTQSSNVLYVDYYTKAEDWGKVSELLVNKGKFSITSGDYQSAKRYLHQALESYRSISNPTDYSELLFEIYLTQAIITRVTDGWVSFSTVAAYQRCISLAKELHSAYRHCISLSGLWVKQLMAMDFELSEQTANEMLRLAEESNDDHCRSLAYSCLTNSQFWLAKHQDAIFNAKESFRYFHQVESDEFYFSIGINPLALAGCFGCLSATLACCDEERTFFQKSVHEVGVINDPFSHSIVLQGEMWSAYHLKRFDEVTELSEQLWAIADSNNFPFYRGVASLFKGWALFFTRALSADQALEIVEEGYSHWLASSGDQIAHSLYCLIRAELYYEVGNLAEAQQILEYGIKIASEKQEACYLSPMYVLLGHCVESGANFHELAKHIALEQGAHLFLK